MSLKYKIIIVIAYTATAVAMGRYLTPEKIKIETKIVEVEKKTVDKNDNKHKHTVITEIDNKDGSKETKTDIVYTDEKTTAVTDDVNKTTDTVKEITKGSDKVTISALGGFDFNTLKPVYGASVSKPLLGPIAIGAWGVSSGQVGISIGLQF